MPETREYQSFSSTVAVAKQEIDGNTYIVCSHDNVDNYDGLVIVYGNKREGGDIGQLPDRYFDIKTRHDELARLKYRDMDESEAAAQCINEAISVMEDSIRDKQSREDAVLAALDANKEITDESS